MKKSTFVSLATVLVLGAGLGFMGGCDTQPKSETDQAVLSANTTAALTAFKARDPSLQALLDKSVGYVVFPNITSGAFILGGANGRGEAFEGGRRIGWAQITQGSIGAQVGGQTFSQLVVFMTRQEFDLFKAGKYTMSANASAVAARSGAAATTDPSSTVNVFVNSTSGLMAAASISGQNMTFRAE